jgi:hypothetical protein
MLHLEHENKHVLIFCPTAAAKLFSPGTIGTNDHPTSGSVFRRRNALPQSKDNNMLKHVSFLMGKA